MIEVRYDEEDTDVGSGISNWVLFQDSTWGAFSSVFDPRTYVRPERITLVLYSVPLTTLGKARASAQLLDLGYQVNFLDQHSSSSWKLKTVEERIEDLLGETK